MNQSMYKVVYCSRNLISGSSEEREAEIAQILETARRNNRAAQITGALLFSSDHFAQVLEGPREPIETIFERIQLDARHGEVTVLEHLPTTQRDFGEWSMAYISAAETQSPDIIDAKLKQAIDSRNESGEQVLHLLKSLVLQED